MAKVDILPNPLPPIYSLSITSDGEVEIELYTPRYSYKHVGTSTINTHIHELSARDRLQIMKRIQETKSVLPSGSLDAIASALGVPSGMSSRMLEYYTHYAPTGLSTWFNDEVVPESPVEASVEIGENEREEYDI